MSFLERDTSLGNHSCELVTSTLRPILTPHLVCIRFLLCTSTVQFILSTVHIITILVQLIEGFVTTSGISQGSTQYFFDMGTGAHVTQEAAYVFNVRFSVFIILLLRVFIYVSRRVWLETGFLSGVCIWFGGRIVVSLSYQWVTYFRVYELLGLIGYLIKGFASIWDNQWLYFQHQPMHLTITVCVCRAIFNLTRLDSNETLFLTQVTTWLVALWAMSVTLQVLCTTLIASRIWWDSRLIRKAGFGLHRQMSVVWIIVESGAIYSIGTVFLMTFFLLKTQAGAIIGHPLGQISVSISPRIRYTKINELHPCKGYHSDFNCGPCRFGSQPRIQFTYRVCVIYISDPSNYDGLRNIQNIIWSLIIS